MNNKKEDSDNLNIILSENESNTITYSKVAFVSLTKSLPIDYLKLKSKLNSIEIPYSIIKTAKKARDEMAKEIIFFASERPDKNSKIRSTLDLWGLSSYSDYLYTTSELVFLEGLTPTFEVGLLSPSEIKRLSEIIAFYRLTMPGSNIPHYEDHFGKDYTEKFIAFRKSMFEWTGKLNLPIIANLIVGRTSLESKTKDAINAILDVHQQYDHIQCISIKSQDVILRGEASDASDNALKRAIEYIQSKQSSITICISPINLKNIQIALDSGITDFDSISINPKIIYPNTTQIDIDELHQLLDKYGFKLKQRLPIMYQLIKSGRYSKKLGQVYDSYKYKIKKYEQEKIKD